MWSRRAEAARISQLREQRRDLLRRGIALAARRAMLRRSPLGRQPALRRRRRHRRCGTRGLAAACQLANQDVAATCTSFHHASRTVPYRRNAFEAAQIAERGGELIDTAHYDIIDLASRSG